MKEFWDERYADSTYVYGKTPNRFIKDYIDTHESGKILFPAEGEGRNAVYSATKGWAVTAFDYSVNARNKALNLAKEFATHIEYVTANIRDFPFTPNLYDAVGLCYVHLPPEDRKWLHKKVISSLKVGGKIVLEAFSKEQLTYNTGGPKRIEMLFSLDDLRQDFQGLKLIQIEQRITKLEEGNYHHGNASIVRIIAEKSE